MSGEGKHVVMFSGGIGSWATAKRVAERHGTDDLILLFADTHMEDEDLYRFIEEAAENVGGEFVRIEDGRDPWQVFFDVRYLGNTRVDPCSRVLKREPLRRWTLDNRDPATTTIYLGIDWTESHRIERARDRYLPFRAEAPMCDEPYVSKDEMIAMLEAEGIAPPRLYGMGFAHNNCGGFCVKSGQAQFANLLKTNRERYLYHEQRELELQEYLGKPVTVMRDRRQSAKSTRLSMREFRERIESAESEEAASRLFDPNEWGGCGCAL